MVSEGRGPKEGEAHILMAKMMAVVGDALGVRRCDSFLIIYPTFSFIVSLSEPSRDVGGTPSYIHLEPSP